MSDERHPVKKTRGAASELSQDIDRLARRAGVSREDVYAFLCTGYTGSGGGPGEWLDRDVSNDVRKYLPILKT